VSPNGFDTEKQMPAASHIRLITAGGDCADVIRSALGGSAVLSTHPNAASALAEDLSDASAPIVIDAALPADIFKSELRAIRSKQTAVHEAVLIAGVPKQQLSPKAAFMAGVIGIADLSASKDDLGNILNRLSSLNEMWATLEEDSFLQEKIRICISAMHAESSHHPRPLDTLESRISSAGYINFVNTLAIDLSLTPHDRLCLENGATTRLFEHGVSCSIPRSQLLRSVSEYTGLHRLTTIDPKNIALGVLPPAFCRKNHLIPLRLHSDSYSLVLGNPFDWELITVLKHFGIFGAHQKLYVTDPALIETLLSSTAYEGSGKTVIGVAADENIAAISSHKVASYTDVRELSDHILDAAVRMRATDIHIEPKSEKTLVRFRIDGDLHDFTGLDEIGPRLVSRLKVLGQLDITESRKPQDGSMNVVIRNRRFSLRLATTATPFGESLTVRLLETDAGLQSLLDLGMTEAQERATIEMAGRHAGMILFVGPTGSGKTTSIYSTLSHIDCESRSLVSAEDPIEYSIPYANQQQVNLHACVTFETLLKSSVRQDPDILFIGEIRDQFSAQIVMDFTSTGRLTFSSLHTLNAVTAIFRLERLGISRAIMAETIMAIIAQRLIKKLCPECKETGPLTEDERAIFSRFTDTPPEQVARPVGCVFCNKTGYFGRIGIFEILRFSPNVTNMVASGTPISEIRSTLRANGEYLIFNHAIDKVRQLECSPSDIFSNVLLEEIDTPTVTCCDLHPPASQPPDSINPDLPHDQNSATGQHSRSPYILVIDDDPAVLDIVTHMLSKRGYTVDTACDGIDALMKLGNCTYDLIISDIMMPNLDGFKMLEMFKLKGVAVPVMFMTALSDPESELKGFELGAVDFIRKPFELGIMAQRIARLIRQEN
jgi:type IV pilus assembly protein PilB